MSETTDPDDMSLEELYAAAKEAHEENPPDPVEKDPGASDSTCPRCGSEHTKDDVTTDIPGDGEHDHGCDDCLYVWDEP